MTYRCYTLPFEKDALLHYGQQLGLATVEQSLHHVAAAIALHPLWQEVPQCLGIVCAAPTPVLAILGTFSAKALGQISLQAPFLNQACRRLRYVTYAEATETCEQLADQLKTTFGLKNLREFQFYGVPRGGLIVLGMLSYMLGLRAEQLNAPQLGAPVVIVDDCALSGSRFYRVLQQYPQQDLMFATLYSHLDLRRAIAARESNVIQCLSGQDLYDHGPETMGSNNYTTWQTQNQARLAGHRYWLGLPDYICFPWNEPDHLLWNPSTASLEQSWHILPPGFCLKNRPSSGTAALPIQVQPTVQEGWLQPTEHIVFGELNDQVLIGHLSTGETFGLSDKAAAFWWVILKAEGLEGAIAQLSGQYPGGNLRSELTHLIEQLIQQQILQPPRQN